MLKLAKTCNPAVTRATVYSKRRMFNSVKDKNHWRCSSTLPYAFMACRRTVLFQFYLSDTQQSTEHEAHFSTRIYRMLVTFLDWTEGCIELQLSALRALPGARPWNVFHHPLNTGIASHMVSTQQTARRDGAGSLRQLSAFNTTGG